MEGSLRVFEQWIEGFQRLAQAAEGGQRLTAPEWDGGMAGNEGFIQQGQCLGRATIAQQ